MKPGFLTSEFWVALAALAGKVVAFLVTVKAAQTTDPNQLSTIVSEVVSGIGAIVALTHGSNTYVRSRTELKARALAQQPPRAIDMRPPRQPGVR